MFLQFNSNTEIVNLRAITRAKFQPATEKAPTAQLELVVGTHAHTYTGPDAEAAWKVLQANTHEALMKMPYPALDPRAPEQAQPATT